MESFTHAVEYGDGGLGEIVPENPFDKIHADPRKTISFKPSIS
jgi:hypothetical protein